MCRSIHKLQLTTFIDILLTGDYSLLLLNAHSSEDIQEAWPLLTKQWEVLYTEYIESITGKEMLAKMATVTDTVSLQAKLGRAETILSAISALKNPEHVDSLIELLYLFNYPLPAYTGTNHEAVITTFIAYYKSEHMDLQLMATVEGESNEQITIDFDYFMSTIVDMNIGMKSSIDINTLSVGAYCAYINKYRQYCKAMSKKTSENGNNDN